MVRRRYHLVFMAIAVLVAGVGNVLAQERNPREHASTAINTVIGAGFTYQGYLEDGSGPVNGTCDFQFSLFDAETDGTQIGGTLNHTASVNSGYFTVTSLDFGAGAFNGEERYLEIAVRCPSGAGSYTVLSPRQMVAPTPYALALPGLYTTPSVEGPNLIGGYIENWVADGVWSATIGGGGVSWGYNRVTDHVGVVSGGANNQAGDNDGDFWSADGAVVSGGWNNTASGPITVVGGGADNSATTYAATVAGGWGNLAGEGSAAIGGGNFNTATGGAAVIGGGERNINSGWAATISGGFTNTIYADAAFIGGGGHNLVNGAGWGSVIVGGDSNTAGDWVAFVGGGYNNLADGSASTIVGGTDNIAHGPESSVLGGSNNTASGQGATVAGGQGNAALGNYSLAAGHNAGAYHDGTFVWNDATGSLLTSGGPNQFIVGASGGTTFLTSEASFSGDMSITGDLEIGGHYTWQAGKNFQMQGSGEWSFDFDDSDGNDHWYVWSPTYSTILTVQNDGKVGVGTGTPTSRFEVAGGDVYLNNAQLGIGTPTPDYPIEIYSPSSYVKFSDTDDGVFDNWLIGLNGSNHRFEIWEETSLDNWELRLWIDQNGMVGVKTLQITGGDLAEPFLVTGEVKPGMVVVIDPQNPGQLRLSDQAFDTLVAGCVSGANGLDAGILMYQEIGEDENAFPVALSGRVYCWADASYGPIQPGDFLTTSDTPGHLMVVHDYQQAQGAIVGKAMTGLEEGTGLILVLITLQ